MRKYFGIALVMCLCAGAAVTVLADEPDYRQIRREVLLSDLQTTVGLSAEQMAELDQLSLAHLDAVVAVVREIGQIHLQLRELRENFEANHRLIFHLEFEIMVKELERAGLGREFAENVNGVLLEDQQDYQPLVLRVLEEVYHFRPPRPGGEGGESQHHGGRG